MWKIWRYGSLNLYRITAQRSRRGRLHTSCTSESDGRIRWDYVTTGSTVHLKIDSIHCNAREVSAVSDLARATVSTGAPINSHTFLFASSLAILFRATQAATRHHRRLALFSNRLVAGCLPHLSADNFSIW